MKLFSLFATLLLTALSVSSPAGAQQEMPRGRDSAQGRIPGDFHRPMLRRNDQRTGNGAGETQFSGGITPVQQSTDPRPIQEQGQSSSQGRERMSPEERRQLRRDINAAGRDIYRRNRSE